jgi:sugar/nucleoside kinase (ribokinase family)
MQALFIGQTYIDVTFLTDRLPVGDEKHVASAYAISFGGNAVTAAFCCAKLSIVPDLITPVADDWLGRMFLDMAAKYATSASTERVRSWRSRASNRFASCDRIATPDRGAV